MISITGWSVRAVHEHGLMQSVDVTGPQYNQRYILASTNLLLPGRLQSWEQSYTGQYITLKGTIT